MSFKAKRRLFLVALLFLLWPLVAWCAARLLVVNSETLEQANVIVVLGGSSTYLERTHRAAQLFQAGRAAKIVLTNDNLRGSWSSAEQRNPLFVELAARELRSAGVPAEKIETLPQVVASTHDEALLLRRYMEANKLRSLIVVTSAYHSRRALWTFRRAFDESTIIIGIESARVGTNDAQSPSAWSWWLTRRGWRAVALEYPKLVYYQLRYR